MADTDSTQKDKNYWQVLDTVIRLEVSKGHLLWKMTDLARLSRVGRPLIYYYFGKSKEEIVQTALKIIGDEFFGLSTERIALLKEGQLLESLLRTRELIKRAPYMPVFYFHWRHQAGEIADQLKDLEKRYLKKLAAVYPKKSPQDIEALFACVFGAALLPQVKAEALEQLFKGL